MRMTPEEIKLLVFVLVMLLLGAGVKQYRASHPRSLPSTPAPKSALAKPASP